MKALVIHASAGAGHTRAAEALADAFQQAGADTVVCDMLEFTPPIFRKTYAQGYLNVVRTVPELWGYMYAQTDRKSMRPWERRLRTAFNKLNTLSFSRFFRRTRPDAVVCTHFLPLELLGAQTGEDTPRPPLFGVMTDFAAHSLWAVRNVDGYFVATEEARRQLNRRGCPLERIWVTGIPVDRRFSRILPESEIRQRLGMNPALPVILVLCGGFGVGPAVEIVQAFRTETLRAQLVVVAGRNKKLQQKLAAEARTVSLPVRVQGFVGNMHEFINAADIVVSKPGGLTVAEVLAQGKPLAIIDPIPGQEQRNGEYLLEAGAAVRLFDAAEAPWKIKSLFDAPRRLERLRRGARRIAKPQAAIDIVQAVMAAAQRP
jgi:processive 1,2-diacylglycerol beta-glucosyltransferase